jgi:uncharacterized protein YoxC
VEPQVKKLKCWSVHHNAKRIDSTGVECWIDGVEVMDISLSVAIIAGLIFIITVFIVVALIKVFKALTEAQKLMETVRLQVAPIAHDLTHILSDVRSIVRSAEKEMGKVGESITAVRDTTRNIQEFEAMIQERIERPLLDVTAVLSALVKGGRVFWNNFNKS